MMLNLVLSVACKDRQTYKDTLQHLVSTFLRPGGLLLLVDARPRTEFYPPAKQFPDKLMQIDREFIEEACAHAGVQLTNVTEDHHEGENLTFINVSGFRK